MYRGFINDSQADRHNSRLLTLCCLLQVRCSRHSEEHQPIMKVLLLLLFVIGLAAADAWPGRIYRSADPGLKAREAYLGVDYIKLKAREASPGRAARAVCLIGAIPYQC
ncbi:uncharacterized protein LOC135374068 isoform X1 [Ornithodoros turicata]|uniref:uncharacterized protein LOC135374068 isoform X1 n=1 Tax=Ornithodoros turicata TaxID=34597 RepID=UPI003138B73B